MAKQTPVREERVHRSPERIRTLVRIWLFLIPGQHDGRQVQTHPVAQSEPKPCSCSLKKNHLPLGYEPSPLGQLD